MRTLLREQIPAELARTLAAAFSRDDDLPRVLPRDARFQVEYEARHGKGAPPEVRIRRAVLDDGARLHRLYGFRTESGALALVHDDGRGVAWIRLAKPLPGAIVTSPFGWRTHPVFGDRRFHRGIDLGAPAGTPILAAASGVVEELGWRGNYGMHLRIRHDGHLQTSYSHLAGFLPGIEVGSRVTRGQPIGWVGQTGVATGPHLYFEVLVDRVQVDPLAAPAAFPIRLTRGEINRLRQPGQERASR